MSFLAETEKWDRERLEAHQWKRIKCILDHAYNHSRFYRQRFEKIGLHPEDIEDRKDFTQIPVLTRQDINDHLDDLLADNIAAVHFDSTGGSTGLPTRFARDNACLNIKKASEYRFNRWAGWLPGEKILYYWPALMDFADEQPSFQMIRSKVFTRGLRLYSGKLNDRILSEHVRMYRRFNPSLVRAFPSALHRFCEYVERTGAELPPVKAIISVGESLHDHQREVFKRILKGDVFNCYVSRETANMACECSEHSGLHVAEEMIYLEISPQGTGDYGDILVTDLYNMGMPFIRYRIQDAARLIDKKCSCGKAHKMIGIDAGRLSDFLISPVDGSFISGSSLTHHLLAEGPRMGRIKLIQSSPNQLRILVTGNESSCAEARDHLKARIDILFQGKMSLDFEYTENIPLLDSGKFSVVERRF